MPLYSVAFVEPFKVELLMVKHDVGTNKVRRNVGHETPGENPIGCMPIGRSFQTSQNGMVGAVAWSDIEDLFRLCFHAAGIDEIVCRGDEFRKRIFRHKALHADIAGFEIMLSLFLC